MIYAKGQLYDERWDTTTILDEQEAFRRDPADNAREAFLFRSYNSKPMTRSAASQQIVYRNLIDKIKARARERRFKALPGNDKD